MTSKATKNCFRIFSTLLYLTLFCLLFENYWLVYTLWQIYMYCLVNILKCSLNHSLMNFSWGQTFHNILNTKFVHRISTSSDAIWISIGWTIYKMFVRQTFFGFQFWNDHLLFNISEKDHWCDPSYSMPFHCHQHWLCPGWPSTHTHTHSQYINGAPACAFELLLHTSPPHLINIHCKHKWGPSIPLDLCEGPHLRHPQINPFAEHSGV